jgi:hypothetical protein
MSGTIQCKTTPIVRRVDGAPPTEVARTEADASSSPPVRPSRKGLTPETAHASSPDYEASQRIAVFSRPDPPPATLRRSSSITPPLRECNAPRTVPRKGSGVVRSLFSLDDVVPTEPIGGCNLDPIIPLTFSMENARFALKLLTCYVVVMYTHVIGQMRYSVYSPWTMRGRLLRQIDHRDAAGSVGY